jgi:hypothetical protein
VEVNNSTGLVHFFLAISGAPLRFLKGGTLCQLAREEEYYKFIWSWQKVRYLQNPLGGLKNVWQLSKLIEGYQDRLETARTGH